MQESSESINKLQSSLEKDGQAIEKILYVFPVLKTIEQSDHQFCNLINLISEISTTNRQTGDNYFLMYNIIRIGSIFDALFVDKIKNLNKINQDWKKTELEKCSLLLEINALNENQQIALFLTARNIAADFFHYISVVDSNKFINEFLSLCIGNNKSSYLIDLVPKLRKVQSQHKKGINENTSKNMLAQSTYFLEKSLMLIDKDDICGACMSIIAAGNCARDFNISGFNQKKMQVTQEITNLRQIFSHTLTLISNIEDLKKELLKIKVDISKYIELIKLEANQHHSLNVDYSDIGDQSPRNYVK